MALSGELSKYIGNEIIKVGKKDLANKTATSALSSVIPKAFTKVGAGIANKAGDSLLNQATALGITKNDANKWILNTGILDTDEGVSKIKDFMNPILGGDKTPNYQRFLEQIGEGEYQMGHRPNLYVGDSETKFPLSNMEADPDYLPKIYGDNEASTVRNLLALGNTGPDAQRSAKIIAQYQNQPDKMVKIFRQAPKDMNYGDWVGLSEEYANNHIGNNPNNKLWEREVPASEVMFAGDDINEWGYYPKEVQLDDVIANELNKAIEISGTNMGVAKRADSYLGGRMLDKNGKPMTFYHGSPSMGITDFDINMAGKNTRSGERAIWFTDDYPTAEEFSYERIPGDTLFADKRVAKGKVYERNLGLENPLDLSNLSDKQIEELYKYADSRMAFDGKDNFIRRMKEFRDAGNDQLIKSQLDMKKLSNSEYDGIVAKMYPGENDVREIGVFDAGKIKKPVRNIPIKQDNYSSLYHQTSAKNLADFSLDKRKSIGADYGMPEGIFLKDTNADIGLPGKNQLKLDAKTNNPITFENRQELASYMEKRNPEYKALVKELDEINETYDDYLMDYMAERGMNPDDYFDFDTAMNDVDKYIEDKAREAREMISAQLKKDGYDGAIVNKDVGTRGRSVKSYVVLDKEQLRDNSVPVRRKNSVLSDDDASMLMQNYDSNKANKLNGNDTSADELVVRNIASKNGVSGRTMEILKNYSTITDENTYQKYKTILNSVLTKNNKEIDTLDKMSRELLSAMGIEFENDMPVLYRATTANEKGSLSYTTDKKIAERLLKNDDTYKKVIRYVVKPNDIIIAPQFLGPLDTGADLSHVIVKKA